ncbi:MAG: hypothetical protein WC683_05175 [bacterium]
MRSKIPMTKKAGRRGGQAWTSKQRAKNEATITKKGQITHRSTGEGAEKKNGRPSHEDLTQLRETVASLESSHWSSSEGPNFPVMRHLIPPLSAPFEVGGRSCAECGRRLVQDDYIGENLGKTFRVHGYACSVKRGGCGHSAINRSDHVHALQEFNWGAIV